MDEPRIASSPEHRLRVPTSRCRLPASPARHVQLAVSRHLLDFRRGSDLAAGVRSWRVWTAAGRAATDRSTGHWRTAQASSGARTPARPGRSSQAAASWPRMTWSNLPMEGSHPSAAPTSSCPMTRARPGVRSGPPCRPTAHTDWPTPRRATQSTSGSGTAGPRFRPDRCSAST